MPNKHPRENINLWRDLMRNHKEPVAMVTSPHPVAPEEPVMKLPPHENPPSRYEKVMEDPMMFYPEKEEWDKMTPEDWEKLGIKEPERIQQGPGLPPSGLPERNQQGPGLPPSGLPERNQQGPGLPPSGLPGRNQQGLGLPPITPHNNIPPRGSQEYNDLVNQLIAKWAQPTEVETQLGMAEMINRLPPAPNSHEYRKLVHRLLKEWEKPKDILSFKKGGVVKGKKDSEVIVKVHEGEVVIPKKTAKVLRDLLEEERPAVKKRIIAVKRKKKPFKIVRENGGVGKVRRYFKGKRID
jgi:hypothetical protein